MRNWFGLRKANAHSPRQGDGVSQHQSSHTTHEQAGEHYSIAVAIYALERGHQARAADHKRQDNHNARWQRWTGQAAIASTVFTTLAIGFSGLGAYYARLSEKDARDSAKEARQSNDMNAESGRAWLGPGDASMDKSPVIGDPINIVITYENTGREPARALARYAVTDIVEAQAAKGESVSSILENRLSACLKTTFLDGGQVAWPTSPPSNYNLTARVESSPIENGIRSGTKALALTGCFAYITAGKLRHTAYCFYFEPGISKFDHMNICQGGNYAD